MPPARGGGRSQLYILVPQLSQADCEGFASILNVNNERYLVHSLGETIVPVRSNSLVALEEEEIPCMLRPIVAALACAVQY
jgi:hypothetical protein